MRCTTRRTRAPSSAEATLAALREGAALTGAAGTDLLVLDWPVGATVLEAMRAEGLLAPTVVFAPAGAVDEAERRRALSLGATETIAAWPDLFREIARVLGPGGA